MGNDEMILLRVGEKRIGLITRPTPSYSQTDTKRKDLSDVRVCRDPRS
jgi:hypothetical protein